MSAVNLVSIREHLAEVVEPVKRDLELVRARREEIRLEAVELSRAEADLLAVLKRLDPTALPQPNGNGTRSNGGRGRHAGRSSAVGGRYSPETLSAMSEWLEAHKNEYPEGFVATDLARKRGGDLDLPVRHQSGLSAAFRQMHETGLLRLSEVEGRGGAKRYKLVS